MRNGGVHQRFAVWARHQNSRGDFELDCPKRALADDVGDRLAALAPRDQLFERARNLVWRVQQQLLAIDTERMCEQQLRIEQWRVGYVRETLRGLRNRAHASSRPASRSASSSAIRASTNSPRPGPSRIASSLCSVRLMRWSVTRPCGKL